MLTIKSLRNGNFGAYVKNDYFGKVIIEKFLQDVHLMNSSGRFVKFRMVTLQYDRIAIYLESNYISASVLRSLLFHEKELRDQVTRIYEDDFDEGIDDFDESDDEPTTKECSKCGVEKPLSEFYRQADSYLGHRADCIECKRAADKGRRQVKRMRAQIKAVK